MAAEVHVSEHPLVRHKIRLLRDQRTDPRQFREILAELAVLIAYEATADLVPEETTVMTPLGLALGYELKVRVGLVPILRAGLGMVDGIWNLIPNAEVWHIGLVRDEETLEPSEYYRRLPVSPSVDVCVVRDPMLATGGSATRAIDILKKWGAERIRFLGVIGAAEGVKRVTKAHPDVPIYLAAIDDELNEAGFIVPGLGDAGDRQFGTG